jgi:hypothetical protein
MQTSLTVFMKFILFGFIALLFATGCTQSPNGSVEELLKTAPPTFGGQLARLYTTPSTAFILTGECDPFSYAIEWSYGGSNWTEIAGGCPNRTFSINVLVNRQIYVHVRARTKTGYTPTAIATIRLILPPTSPYLKLVSTSRADDTGPNMNMQNEGNFITALTMSNGLWGTIKSSMVDIIYE